MPAISPNPRDFSAGEAEFLRCPLSRRICPRSNWTSPIMPAKRLAYNHFGRSAITTKAIAFFRRKSWEIQFMEDNRLGQRQTLSAHKAFRAQRAPTCLLAAQSHPSKPAGSATRPEAAFFSFLQTERLLARLSSHDGQKEWHFIRPAKRRIVWNGCCI